MSGTRTRRPRNRDNAQPLAGWPVPSGPNSVPTAGPRGVPAPIHTPHAPSKRSKGCSTGSPRTAGRPNWSAFHPRAPPQKPATHHNDGPSRPERGSAPTEETPAGEMLLRKEVIQPHLPVRLPCYDFVPIADPAFDGSLHKGWATGFG